MTAQERATAGAVRSAHVAHFLPPDWGRISRIVAPALQRLARDVSAPQLLILVPDAGAAVALARALAATHAAEGRRIVAATSAARAKRLLAAGPADVVIGAPGALAPALAASALKLDQLVTVCFAAADELDPEDADLAAILAEVPRTAGRLLTALEPTPAVEALIERQMHKARRVTEDLTAAAVGTTTLRYFAVAGEPADAVPLVLDEIDAPSATIVASDAAAADAARAVLHAIGHTDGALAHVSDGEVAPNTALVILLGVPTGTVWAGVLSAKPSQVVAIIAPRQRAALQMLAGEQAVPPFVSRAAILRARAAEARARAELQDVLTAGIPAREVLALEPLLGEYDGLEIAAAALRLLDRTRASQEELVRAAEQRVRQELKQAQAERDAAERAERPRGVRLDRRDLPRGFGEDRPPRAPRRDDGFPLREPRGDKPRGSAPRGDKPRGPRRDDDRGPRGPRRDDDRGPRGPRRDDDRGPRAPRGPRGPR